MRPTSDLPGYGTPFYLFGHAPPRAARSLPQLIAAGLLSRDDAGVLVSLVERRVSLAIVAPEAARGKSTLLAALLAYRPRKSDCYFLRGSYETFQFARDVSWRPGNAVLIANEVSDFLPVYLPAHLTSRLFRYVGQGASLWTTAHARGLDDLLSGWPQWPASAPLAVVAIGDDQFRAIIEVNEPARRIDDASEPTSTIDSVCHAEGGVGSETGALPICVSASGLRPG